MKFREHYRGGKKYNLDSNLNPELNSFFKDGKLDRNENIILNKILEYNENKNREKEIIRKLTDEKLKLLIAIPGLRNYVKKRINRILSYAYKNKEAFKEQKKELIKWKKEYELDSVMGFRKKRNNEFFEKGGLYYKEREKDIKKRLIDKSKYTMRTPIRAYPDGIEGLLAYIGAIENIKFSYDSMIGYSGKRNGFKRVFGKSLRNFTVNQVLAKQRWFRRKTRIGRKLRSAAVGAYQFIPGTIKDLKRRRIIRGNQRMTNALQDKMALGLLYQIGLKKFLAGKMSKRVFAHKIATKWASFPDPYKGGRSYYSKNGIDSAHTTLRKVYAILDKLKRGERKKRLRG